MLNLRSQNKIRLFFFQLVMHIIKLQGKTFHVSILFLINPAILQVGHADFE